MPRYWTVIRQLVAVWARFRSKKNVVICHFHMIISGSPAMERIQVAVLSHPLMPNGQCLRHWTRSSKRPVNAIVLCADDNRSSASCDQYVTLQHVAARKHLCTQACFSNWHQACFLQGCVQDVKLCIYLSGFDSFCACTC